ncbi:MAG: MFS transporter [Gammaproteobacteria bacterium]|nr:MFS transporter [Gammaproteobacteria bacterium]
MLRPRRLLFRSPVLSRREARYLVMIRGARSIGQGALAVDFALYLHALHWTAPQIGALFMVALLVSALGALIIGPLSDNRGRKRFLIGYEIVQVAASLLALASSSPLALIVAAIAGGFGHGLNGGAGPFAPVELAWLSTTAEAKDRAALYSINTAAGFSGMALGSVLASLPHFFAMILSGATSYRPLFVLVLISALVGLILLARLPEPTRETESDTDQGESHSVTRTENRKLLQLLGVNALNGLGIGLLGPMMAYWFAIRFHHGPLSIGPVMGLALVVTAATSLMVGRLTHRFGVMRSILTMRYLGLVVLVLLPLMPTFGMAACLYILRSALNRGTVGARQALNIGIVRAHRRGLAASLSNASTQVPRALGPVVAGLLYHAGFLTLPFFIAGGFQAAYLVAYGRLFADHPAAPAS